MQSLQTYFQNYKEDLPIRVELSALNEKDFIRILKEPDNSLIKQYKALLKTENVDLEFKDDGIEMLAKISTEVNSSIENIGARRLHYYRKSS